MTARVRPPPRTLPLGDPVIPCPRVKAEAQKSCLTWPSGRAAQGRSGTQAAAGVPAGGGSPGSARDSPKARPGPGCCALGARPRSRPSPPCHAEAPTTRHGPTSTAPSPGHRPGPSSAYRAAGASDLGSHDTARTRLVGPPPRSRRHSLTQAPGPSRVGGQQRSAAGREGDPRQPGPRLASQVGTLRPGTRMGRELTTRPPVCPRTLRKVKAG